MSKNRRKRRRDVLDNQGPDSTYDSPRKRSIPDGKFKWKDGVSLFARTVDSLAEKTASIITMGRTEGIHQNIMQKFLVGGTSAGAHEASFMDTGGIGTLYSGNDAFGSDDGPTNPLFDGLDTSSSSRKKSSGMGGFLRRRRRAAQAARQQEEEDVDEDDASSDEEGAAANESNAGRPGNSPFGSPAPRTRKNRNAEQLEGDSEEVCNTTNDFSPGDFNGAHKNGLSTYKSAGTFLLGISLAVCWAIILLAIPLMPILIASWLVTDFLQSSVLQ